jgi:hypothetical protein
VVFSAESIRSLLTVLDKGLARTGSRVEGLSSMNDTKESCMGFADSVSSGDATTSQ